MLRALFALIFVGACAGERAHAPLEGGGNPRPRSGGVPTMEVGPDDGVEKIGAAISQPPGVGLSTADADDLQREGRQLWSEATLGTNGKSCASCHAGEKGEHYAGMKETFATPYPHPVAMADERAGLPELNAAEMVQLCVVVSLAGQPKAWDSRELAALTAYVGSLQTQYK